MVLQFVYSSQTLKGLLLIKAMNKTISITLGCQCTAMALLLSLLYRTLYKDVAAQRHRDSLLHYRYDQTNLIHYRDPDCLIHPLSADQTILV